MRGVRFYVNASTGSDTLDSGRGESEDKPFKSLQAVINYVAANYNLNTYDATINIDEGYSSTSNIELQSFSTVSGNITITGPDQDHPEYVSIGHIQLDASSNYMIRNLTIKPSNSNSFWQAVYATNGRIDLRNVVIDISNIQVSSGSLHALYTENNGVIRIYAVNNLDTKCGVTIKVSENITSTSLTIVGSAGGEIQFSADIKIEGNATVTQTAMANNLGLINRTQSVYVNPGRAPLVSATGIITGKRYACSRNGIISVAGGGDEFFPGTVAGTTATGGQYA